MDKSDTKDINLKLLDPAVLSGIPNLTLRVNAVISSMINGLHRSMYHGSSIEFSEHKTYSDGDEPKWIDWKLYAKTDKYYVKQFESESNLKSYIVLDKSASMGYRGEGNTGMSKLEYASILSASLAYILIKQHDKVGFLTQSNEKPDFIPPGLKAEHLSLIIDKLEKIKPAKNEKFSICLNALLERVEKRGIIIIISDLLEDENKLLNTLKLLKNKKQNIILIHTLHNSEINFPFNDVMEMFDIEGDETEKFIVEPDRVRDKYLKEIREYIEWWKKNCAINDIEYHLINTDTPLNVPLTRILGCKR